MATLSDMAFDYAMQRGHGRKSYEHFYAGAKAVIKEIIAAKMISETAMIEQIKSYVEEITQS